MNNQDEKRTLRRRRRRRFAGLTAFLLAVLSAVAVLCLAIFFKVQTIAVVGVHRYLDDDIIYVSGIQQEENILAIDTKASEEQIREAFPYVEEVKVVRMLPTTVEIRVTESVPALVVVGPAHSYTLLSASGRMIEQGSGVAREDLPLVVGADFSAFPAGSYGDETAEESLTTLRYVLEAMEDTGIQNINYIDVGDRLNTVLLYDNRVLLSMGSEKDLSGKLRRAMELLDNQLEENYVGRIDLSIQGRGYTERVDVDALMNEEYRENYFKYE